MTKEDIKQICQIYDNFRSERDAATIACNSDDTFWEHILATYNLSQPSIPSNLDEAAEKTSQSAYSEPTAAGFAKRSFFKRGFKAGAEWMAGQGIVGDAEVCKLTDRAWVTILDEKQFQNVLYNKFNAGDKVVVQIRKK